MIREYANGASFIEDNAALLAQNREMAAFFYLDAGILTEPSGKNYALRVTSGAHTLLAMKVEPWNLLLYGEDACLRELLCHLAANGYEVGGVMCTIETGNALIALSEETLGKRYRLSIGMDYMTASAHTGESSREVEIPTEADLDDLFDCTVCFIQDCGLADRADKERLRNRISDFRVIKKNGRIVSMASLSPATETSLKIAHVYTRPDFRGQGLARKVVNAVKNEILDRGKTASLYVDRANPISNHLYESLGFTRVFSQGVYLPL